MIDAPLSTCREASCSGCPLRQTLRCHFTRIDLAYFVVIILTPFIIAGRAIAAVSDLALAGWVIFAVLYFGGIEVRVMCSHCPHYAEPGRVLHC